MERRLARGRHTRSCRSPRSTIISSCSVFLLVAGFGARNPQSDVDESGSCARCAMSAPIQKVLVLVAMREEAEPFVKAHNLQRIERTPWPVSLPMVAFEGRVGRMEVKLVWAGEDRRYRVNNVATTASAVSAYVSMVAFQPQLVVSAGTAGGFRARGARIGDVFLSTKTVYHHRRIPSADPNSTYEEYGFGHFRSPPLELLAAQAGLKTGVVSTSDSLDYTARDLQQMASEGASVKEMEAAAIAWVAQQLHVPFVALKSITDIVDGEKATAREFRDNLAAASEALQAKLSRVLRLVYDKPLWHWMEGALTPTKSRL